MAEIQRKNAKKKSAGRQAWDAVLTGISYMIPFIVGGGVLWGIAKAMGGYNIAADMKAVGGYTETDTYVIITIISKYEIAPLRQMLLEKDPHAFVIMSEGPEIFGNFEKRL